MIVCHRPHPQPQKGAGAKVGGWLNGIDISRMSRKSFLVIIGVGSSDHTLLTRQGIAPGVCNQMMVARVLAVRTAAVSDDRLVTRL